MGLSFQLKCKTDTNNPINSSFGNITNIKNTNTNSTSYNNNHYIVSTTPAVITLHIGEADKVRVAFSQIVVYWITSHLEKVINRPHVENSELYNILKIVWFTTMDEQEYCHTRSNLGISALLEILQSCKLDHEVAWFCTGDRPATHPPTPRPRWKSNFHAVQEAGIW